MTKMKVVPCNDGSARADERDIDVLDLAFPGPSRRLQRPLDLVGEPEVRALRDSGTERADGR